MTDDDGARSPIDQAVDLLVLRPVGLVLDLPSALPRFIRQGRHALHLDTLHLDASLPGDALDQLNCHLHRTLRALGIGTTAQEARGELPDEIEPTDGPAPTDRDIPLVADPNAPGAPDAGHAVVAGATVIGGIATAVDAVPLPAPPRPRLDHESVDVEGPDADGLAIPGYDSLSASQVVPRLESLTADELELVRHYEQANRGRKTILSKIAQLQA